MPTLAELLQSDGETEQLEDRQASVGGQEITRSSVTEGVPSLGALLEEEDTDMSLVAGHTNPQRNLEGKSPGVALTVGEGGGLV